MASLVETSVEGHVALCRLNRPEARNALSPGLREELADALERYDSDDEVNCIVIAGNDDAFAAGADVKALSERSINDELSPSESFWRRLAGIRKPLHQPGGEGIARLGTVEVGDGHRTLALCEHRSAGHVRPSR